MKLQRLGLLITLVGVSATSFAADCPALIQKGLANSVISVSSGVSLSDVDSCLSQCDQQPSTGDALKDAANATQCESSLSTLRYAVNYNNANTVSPSQFVSASGFPTPPSSAFSSAYSAPAPVSTPAPAPTTTAQATPQPAPQNTNQSGFSVNTTALKKISSANHNSTHIRWF